MNTSTVGLAIDTSSSVGSVSLDDIDPPRQKRFSEGLEHGKALLPSVEELLAQAGLRKPSFLSVGLGPGSYTGLRIGVTVARTLAWTWEVPLLGICSLTSIAYGAGPRRSLVAVVSHIGGELGDGQILRRRKGIFQISSSWKYWFLFLGSPNAP